MVRRKKKSFLKEAMEGTWKQSAAMSIFVFIVIFFALPNFTSNSILNFLEPMVLMLAVLLGLIAFFKFIKQAPLDYFNKFATFHISTNSLNVEEDVSTLKRKGSLFVQKQKQKEKEKEKEKEKKLNPNAWSLKLIQGVEWKRFEELSIAYYQEKGMRAEATSLGADGGIDIRLYQSGSDESISIVQCKSWKIKRVGVKEIREFLGVMAHENLAKGLYMTSGDYTDEAKEAARANNIILINGEMFLSMIRRMPLASQQKLLALATTGDYLTPTCSACGIKMIWRTVKRGKSGFWGCRYYPKCRQRLFAKHTVQ